MSLFGWCMDGHHDNCPHAFTDWNHKPQACACPCHKENP